jgi:curved DNA-binding protein CbpA
LAADPKANTGSAGRRGRWAGEDRENGVPAIEPDGAENYYRALGVPYNASRAEITRAYRAAMKRFHPDRQAPAQRAAAEERCKLLNRAYATLSKPAQRQAYDQTIRAQVVQDQIMGRYVGGFAVPGGEQVDPAARHLRRDPTAAERREQARSDRSAMISIVVLFGGVTLAVVALLLLWAAIGALFGVLF